MNMKPLELAAKYMEIFFGGGSMEPLLDLLQPNLVFEGPFFRGESAEEYVESLQSDPPRGLSYEIISRYETETEACIIYKFMKAGITTAMAQKFEVSGGKISKILLIFDTGVFR